MAVLDASSELAEVDAEKLEALLGEFETSSESLTGLLDELAERSGLDVDRPPIEEDDVPEPPAEPITKLGDLWLLGAYFECEDCGKHYEYDEGKAMGECHCV